MRDDPYFTRADTPMAAHVVLIVDESVVGEHLSINGYARDTSPYLATIGDRMCNFGIACSGGNCSRTSQRILPRESRRRIGVPRRGTSGRSPRSCSMRARRGTSVSIWTANATGPSSSAGGSTTCASSPARTTSAGTRAWRSSVSRRRFATGGRPTSWWPGSGNTDERSPTFRRSAIIFHTRPIPAGGPLLSAGARGRQAERGRPAQHEQLRQRGSLGLRWFPGVSASETGKDRGGRAGSVHLRPRGGGTRNGQRGLDHAWGPRSALHHRQRAASGFGNRRCAGKSVRFRENATAKNRASHYEIFPTLLRVMGYNPQDVTGRYGVSLFDPIPAGRERFYATGWHLENGRRGRKEFVMSQAASR